MKKKVAIKVISFDDEKSGQEVFEQFEAIQKEVAMLKSLRHPNVVGCYASFVYDRELWVVMPLVAGGSITDLIRKVPAFQYGIANKPVLKSIMKDILEALAYVHESNSVHRDLKGNNVLISAEGVAKLADFGVARSLIQGGIRLRERESWAGTPQYIAPEMMATGAYNTKADIWSFGITSLELAFGRAPFHGVNPAKVVVLISQMKEPPRVADYYDPNKDSSYKDYPTYGKNFADAIAKCLMMDPNKRWGAKDLLRHKFFKPLNSKKMEELHAIVRQVVFGNADFQKRRQSLKPELPQSLRRWERKQRKSEKKKQKLKIELEVKQNGDVILAQEQDDVEEPESKQKEEKVDNGDSATVTDDEEEQDADVSELDEDEDSKAKDNVTPDHDQHNEPSPFLLSPNNKALSRQDSSSSSITTSSQEDKYPFRFDSSIESVDLEALQEQDPKKSVQQRGRFKIEASKPESIPEDDGT